MDYKIRRQLDCERAQRLESLCKQIYSSNGMDIIRITNAKQQKEGIDFICNDMLVDEKAAIKYWNKDLQTFAFEVSANNNVHNEGWLYSSISKTTHYSLIWVRSADGDLNKITKLEIMIIPKDAIKDYLYSLGYIDANEIKKDLEWRGKDSHQTTRLLVTDDLKLIRSNYLQPECPINAVISKRLLSKMADKHMCYKN